MAATLLQICPHTKPIARILDLTVQVYITKEIAIFAVENINDVFGVALRFDQIALGERIATELDMLDGNQGLFLRTNQKADVITLS